MLTFDPDPELDNYCHKRKATNFTDNNMGSATGLSVHKADSHRVRHLPIVKFKYHVRAQEPTWQDNRLPLLILGYALIEGLKIKTHFQFSKGIYQLPAGDKLYIIKEEIFCSRRTCNTCNKSCNKS